VLLSHAGKTTTLKAVLYVLVQLIGSMAAIAMICATFPHPIESLEAISLRRGANAFTANAFFMEFMLTFIFVFVIFAVAFEIVEKPDRRKYPVVEMGCVVKCVD